MVGNNVYITLSDNLGPDEQPSVEILGGILRDKAGNSFGGVRVGKATDNLGPNLGLAKDTDLSNEEVVITISTDEALSKAPALTLSRVVDSDGSLIGYGARQCQSILGDDEEDREILDDVVVAAATTIGSACGPMIDDPNSPGGQRVPGRQLPDGGPDPGRADDQLQGRPRRRRRRST